MHRFLLCLVMLAAGLSAHALSPREYNLRTMTPEEIDRAALGHTRYDFQIAPLDGLVDKRGRTIRSAGLADYLKRRDHSADAFYFLWITRTSAPMDTLAPTLEALGNYGITAIVIRHNAEAITQDKARRPEQELAKTLTVLRKTSQPRSPASLVEVQSN